MKETLIDTSFILTCIRNKIDFFEEIKFMGIQILIPKQVIKEIKGIMNSRKNLQSKENAKLALKLLEKNSFKEVDLEEKNVDKGIIKYSNKHDTIVATLDREIKNKVKNSKLVIRGKKKLEIM